MLVPAGAHLTSHLRGRRVGLKRHRRVVPPRTTNPLTQNGRKAAHSTTNSSSLRDRRAPPQDTQTHHSTHHTHRRCNTFIWGREGLEGRSGVAVIDRGDISGATGAHHVSPRMKRRAPAPVMEPEGQSTLPVVLVPPVRRPRTGCSPPFTSTCACTHTQYTRTIGENTPHLKLVVVRCTQHETHVLMT